MSTLESTPNKSLLIQFYNATPMVPENLETVNFVKNTETLVQRSDYFEALLKNSLESSTFRKLQVCESTKAKITKISIPGVEIGLAAMIVNELSKNEIFHFGLTKNSKKYDVLESPDKFYRVFEFLQIKSKFMNLMDAFIVANITRKNNDSVFRIGAKFEQISKDKDKQFKEEDIITKKELNKKPIVFHAPCAYVCGGPGWPIDDEEFFSDADDDGMMTESDPEDHDDIDSDDERMYNFEMNPDEWIEDYVSTDDDIDEMEDGEIHEDSELENEFSGDDYDENLNDGVDEIEDFEENYDQEERDVLHDDQLGENDSDLESDHDVNDGQDDPEDFDVNDEPDRHHVVHDDELVENEDEYNGIGTSDTESNYDDNDDQDDPENYEQNDEQDGSVHDDELYSDGEPDEINSMGYSEDDYF